MLLLSYVLSFAFLKEVWYSINSKWKKQHLRWTKNKTRTTFVHFSATTRKVNIPYSGGSEVDCCLRQSMWCSRWWSLIVLPSGRPCLSPGWPLGTAPCFLCSCPVKQSWLCLEGVKKKKKKGETEQWRRSTIHFNLRALKWIHIRYTVQMIIHSNHNKVYCNKPCNLWLL